MTLSGFPQDDYVYFIQSTAEALAASEDVHRKHPDSINHAQLVSLRGQVMTASPDLINVSGVSSTQQGYSLTHLSSAPCTIQIIFFTVMASMRDDITSLFTRKWGFRGIPCHAFNEAILSEQERNGLDRAPSPDIVSA
jgi:hypothetical protein